MSLRIANRYARALADVVGESADYRRAIDELEAFRDVYRESRELGEVFDAPAVPLVSKLRVLDQIVKRLGASLAVSNFLRVLVRNFRMAQLEEINQAFRRVANQRLGIVSVKVFSASGLTRPSVRLWPRGSRNSPASRWNLSFTSTRSWWAACAPKWAARFMTVAYGALSTVSRSNSQPLSLRPSAHNSW